MIIIMRREGKGSEEEEELDGMPQPPSFFTIFYLYIHTYIHTYISVGRDIYIHSTHYYSYIQGRGKVISSSSSSSSSSIAGSIYTYIYI